MVNAKSPQDEFQNKILDFTNLGGTQQEIEQANVDVDSEDDYMEGNEPEIFYTEGCPELKDARLKIANYSLPKAVERLEESRTRRSKVQDSED
jgi:hypothetical protein